MTVRPERMREMLLQQVLEISRSTCARRQPPLGSRAQTLLGDVISAALVGLESQALDILHTALDWSCEAIATNEEHGYSREAHLMFAKRTRAVAAWMLGSPEQAAWWIDLAEHHARYYAELEPRMKPNDAASVNTEQLVFRAHAGQAEEARAYYEQRFGPADGKLTPSAAARRVALEYALATRAEPDRSDVLHRAGRRILASKLEPYWLHNGLYVEAALWLKLVYGGPGSTLTPPQIIRKAYENMPNTPWPDFLPPD